MQRPFLAVCAWLVFACLTSGCIGTIESRFRVRDPNAVTLRVENEHAQYEEVASERPRAETVVVEGALGTWVALRDGANLQLTQRGAIVPGTSYGHRVMSAGWIGPYPKLADELFDASSTTFSVYDTVPVVPTSCAERGELASRQPIPTTACPGTHFTVQVETPSDNITHIEQRESVNRGFGFAPLVVGLVYGALGYWMSTSDTPAIRYPGYAFLGIGIATTSVGIGVVTVGLLRPARNRDVVLNQTAAHP